MAGPSVDKLMERFENPSIPPIKGKPTYATLHDMHELLNSNAASVKNQPCLRHSQTPVHHPLPRRLCNPFDNTICPSSQSQSNAGHPGRRHRTRSSVHPLRARRGDAAVQHLQQR